MKIAECKVELIDSMGTDLSVVNAARVSFHKESFYEFDMDDPFVRYLSNKDMKLLKYLADHNHHILSPCLCASVAILNPRFNPSN